jgi:hypothetical protein
MDQQIFFCHLPKTAGTTLRIALERQFLPEQIVPNAHMMASIGGHYSPIGAVEKILNSRGSEIRLFRGHYHYSAHSWLDDPLTIVVLREPVSRTISEIKHYVSINQITAQDALSALDEGTLPISTDNLMTRYLGGTLFDGSNDPTNRRHHKLLRGPIKDPSKRLDSALLALDTVTILGLTEEFSLLVRDVKRILGINIPEERFNVGRVQAFKVSERGLETIRLANLLDIELYRHARAKLHAVMSTAPEDRI